MTVAPSSLADLLDTIRPLIAAARTDGSPRFVLVPPALFDAIYALRTRDRELGLPATILGLEIVRADDPNAAPRVF